MTRPETTASVRRLDELTRRLRSECPWDREQDERSIVPHTVEEAYELADAAYSGDDAKLLDELGDVLFQVVFLSLLLEERGAGDLGAVAEHCIQKLIRRHPHVFAQVEVDGAADVLRNWDQIKRQERGAGTGPFDDMPSNLPALLYARKTQRRAAAAGERRYGDSDRIGDDDSDDNDAAATAANPAAAPLAALRAELDALEAGGAGTQAFQRVGDALFEAVAAARALGVDPELALREATRRFQARQGDATTG